MKSILPTLFLFFTLNLFSQTTATLPDGRKVILNPNGTWQYENPAGKESPVADCTSSEEDLPKVHKTIDRLKRHAAVENDCTVEDIKVIAYAQGRGDGMYTLCVKGQIMKYKMIGTVFMKAEQDPLEPKK